MYLEKAVDVLCAERERFELFISSNYEESRAGELMEALDDVLCFVCEILS
ncbi:hypothetical protein AALB39_02095 [Lachnospiraceae bacterium 54-53]